jgi:hypothetical protein
MAWYGQAQSVWLTLSPTGLFEINDFLKSIQVLYITTVTTDSKFRTQFARGEKQTKQSWASLILEGYFKYQTNGPVAPDGFPLRYWATFAPGPRQADLARWSEHFLLFAIPRPPSRSP